MAMKSPQKTYRRNNRMAKKKRKTKKTKAKGIETKDDSDRDEYSRQQREHQEGYINNDLENSTAAASDPLNNLGENQVDDIEMSMPSTSIQNRQVAPEEELFVLPVVNRADPFGHIPLPHEHDVLCGRGGSINSHPGNVTFREWVYKRKTQYNLADAKKDKAAVVNEVLNLVRGLHPPGRFLQKHNGGWFEINDAKAMAKISQALREGAPAMRAAHGKKASAKRRSDSTRSPSPPRRESKRRAKKRNFDEYIPSETIPTSSQDLLSNAAMSSAPLTPPPSLDGNEDYHHDDDLMGNEQEQHVHNYFDSGGMNDLFLEQSNGTSVAAGRDSQPQSGYYNASFISPSYSHPPLIPFRDYSASLSEVANAIPPSQIEEQLPRANNVTPNLTSLPPPPISPGGWDPLSFLPSTPKHSRTAVEGMNGQSFFPLTPVHAAGTATAPTSPGDTNNVHGQPFSLTQKQSVRRQHSLDASLGSFSNPFENDSYHFRQHIQSGLPVPNIGPPQRGFSFGMIGGVPRAKEVDPLLRHDTSSYSSFKSSSHGERKHPSL